MAAATGRPIRRIQSHGIRVNGCFLIGLDGHGPDIFDQVLDFAAETELFDVQITIPTPFPGTPFYERLQREGRLLHDGAWQRATLFDINYRPKRMSVEELRDGFHRLAVKLYGDELTQWRRENFRRKYLRPDLPSPSGRGAGGEGAAECPDQKPSPSHPLAGASPGGRGD